MGCNCHLLCNIDQNLFDNETFTGEFPVKKVQIPGLILFFLQGDILGAFLFYILKA